MTNLQVALAIIIAIGVIAYIILTIILTMKAAPAINGKNKIEIVRNWLLVTITEAEKIYGAKTGAIKLSYVYDMFISRMPDLAAAIPFETFSSLVDEVLTTFRKMVNDNKAVKTYVETKPIVLESAGTPSILPESEIKSV